MKISKLTKPFWISAIAMGLITAPLALSSSATGTAPGTTAPGTTDTTGTTTTVPGAADTTTAPDTTTTTVEDDNDGFDWGWLGLLGLLGLAGLARKPEERVQYRDPADVDPASTTRPDYRR
jgi:MYXO-CTERM domain-containing protein